MNRLPRLDPDKEKFGMPEQTEDEEINRALTELARILRRVEETLNYMAAQLSTDDETEEPRAEDAPPPQPKPSDR
jgi:uncharacterized coiled-coil protein SlyX